ncbi:MAG: hypothetical protein KDC91_11205 [Flavobacteriaceae bacterium]|nr:hypothetical protein [Flavobacteriaceae bacterium]
MNAIKFLPFLFFFIGFCFSCKKDDSHTCTTCSSSQTFEFEVCRESNGNAYVNGEDTGTNYDVYITGLEDAGATCGN